MSTANTKKRQAPSQGGPATKKVHVQKAAERSKPPRPTNQGQSKGRVSSHKASKLSITSTTRKQKNYELNEDKNGKKRAVPVTAEPVNDDISDSEGEDESGLEDEREGVEGDEQDGDVMDVDAEDEASKKDPKGLDILSIMAILALIFFLIQLITNPMWLNELFSHRDVPLNLMLPSSAKPSGYGLKCAKRTWNVAEMELMLSPAKLNKSVVPR